MATDTIGLLVMAYGGPNNLDEVEPYLNDVRGGRPTTPAALAEVRERYRQIGGSSPILERTRAQASALQQALNDGGPGGRGVYQAYVGMRHWHPYIAEALADMARAGIRRAVGLVMAPHYSRMSVGAYYKRVDEANAPVEVAQIERWYLLPGYLDALARLVREGLARFPEPLRAQVPILFTAHSLPQRILGWRDPYPDELYQTVVALMVRLGDHPHDFAYQSAAMSPEPWLGPDAGEVLDRLASEGHTNVLMAPIGFVSEHVEILYDIDIACQRQARECGIHLERIDMLNTAPEMVGGLAGLVRSTAEGKGWAFQGSGAA
jgi:ferrochelatase